MNPEEKLALDYKTAVDYFSLLTDIRFKLLAFVPTVSGIAVTIVAESASVEIRLLVGLFGLLATLGIIIYEVHNTQFYDAAVFRAKWLEVMIGMHLCTKGEKKGGLFNERPARPKLLNRIPLWHNLGLAYVYGAALGGWFYLVIDSILTMIGRQSFVVALISAAILALLFARTYLSLGGQGRSEPTDELVKMVKKVK
jgi:hypothetical protein